jgi:hypothetical protein
MKRHSLTLGGSGDFCARSSRSTRTSTTTEDPELRFEEELMAALEPVSETGTETVEQTRPAETVLV